MHALTSTKLWTALFLLLQSLAVLSRAETHWNELNEALHPETTSIHGYGKTLFARHVDGKEGAVNGTKGEAALYSAEGKKTKKNKKGDPKSDTTSPPPTAVPTLSTAPTATPTEYIPTVKLSSALVSSKKKKKTAAPTGSSSPTLSPTSSLDPTASTEPTYYNRKADKEPKGASKGGEGGKETAAPTSTAAPSGLYGKGGKGDQKSHSKKGSTVSPPPVSEPSSPKFSKKKKKSSSKSSKGGDGHKKKKSSKHKLKKTVAPTPPPATLSPDPMETSAPALETPQSSTSKYLPMSAEGSE